MRTDTLSKFSSVQNLCCLIFTVFLLGGVFHTLTAHALNINVVNAGGTAISSYRWTVEEDVTKASVPGQHATHDNYSFSFHSSYMPVLAAGKVAGGAPIIGNDCSDPNNPVGCLDPDRKYMDAASLALDPAKRYYVSVLPDDGNAMGGAPVVFDASGNASVTVYVNKFPVPTAQISVFVFEDNSPLNAAPDLPQEGGLAGFTIFLTEAGGTYGGSGGQVTQDAFGNPLGTTYKYDASGQPILDAGGSPTIVTRGSGIILSGPDGVATIKNLFPAKYTIQVIPPAGSDWHQTTTIEGTKGNDAWVKNGEPPFFQEFGPPGHHVFQGFTHSGFIARNGSAPVLNGSASVTGRVVNIHNSRPPDYTFYPNASFPNATPIPQCWVALNETAGGRALYAAPCNADSTFAIPDVPAGTYELVVWDEPLDVIMASATITVAAAETTHALGDVPVFNWFAKYEGRVFYDANGNGFPDVGEVGIADQAQNIRFRDGSIYQSTFTNAQGEFKFTEVFPFFNWMIAEVDYGRFKATGATVVADEGGPIPTHSGWAMPSFNKLNPQTQTCTQEDVDANTGASSNLCTAVGQTKPYRVEQGVILLEGMQTFLGQTNHIEWGKKLYAGQENGGIAGIVQYGITRAEDDPKNGTAETWEPGIPRVQVNLLLDCDGDNKPDRPNSIGNGTCATVDASSLSSLGYVYDQPDVDNYPFCWRDPVSCGSSAAQIGPEDRKRSRTGAATTFSYGDAFTWGADPDNGGAPYVGLGKTDGWDDALPSGCPAGPSGAYSVPYGSDAGYPLDCYDGLRNWNQVRPAVFDGGYAFGSVAGQTNLPNVKYILEAVAPPGYFHQGNGDKNVTFGDQVAPAPLAEPYACAGMDLPVPQYLTLFPDVQDPNPMYNAANAAATWKKCDMKVVDMQPGRNAAPNFFLYTEAPVSGHGVGFILDDTSSEFDVNAPTFGEKHAPPHLPVSIRDWTGREISRVYADEFGSYNFLVPSTFTINPPFPSGVGPSMMVSCMNSPGPITDNRQFLADGVSPNPTFGQQIIDPYFDRQYSQFCYTLQYLPGKTTYLDTPVVPVAAFAGRTQNPLDCEQADGTPMIYSVTNNANTGPWVSGAGQTLTILSAGDQVQVLNPYYDPAGNGSTKLINRDYGFGATKGSVKIGGTIIPAANIPTWTKDMIVMTVPSGTTTGQLSVTRGDNSIASTVGVTVTVGGSAPIAVPAGGNIQAVIDAPTTLDGALVTVPPGIYNEYVIMDKKIQLQGWGALSTTINAAKFSVAGLKNWRTLINRKIDARPANPPVIDPDTGLNTINAGPLRTFDLLPGQTLGSNISNNEPLLFGAEEGPGVMVLGSASSGGNRHVFNNTRNARIDGLTITGADYGGGILASGYARYLEISNNRVVSNYGTYGGGIRIGHTALLDETNTAYGGYTDSVNPNVKIHNNWISENGSTEAGAGGGISLGNGASNYSVTSNQICGNFSMADGGGIGHLGLSNGGTINNNRIVFNQTFNQSANPTGGGVFIGGEASLDGSGLSPGTGSVSLTQNLIQGNNAGAGAGGGVRLAQINGLDVTRSTNNASAWNTVAMVNNMIVDNVAAYAGGGVSMVDALRVNASNNTIANNDSTGTNQQAFPAAGSTTSNAQPAGLVSHATTSALQLAIGNPNGSSTNAQLVRNIKNTPFSNPTLFNNIVWHNRSFCWAITGPNPGEFGLFDANADGSCTGKTSASPTAGSNPVYVDLAVLGTANQGTFANRYVGSNVAKLTPDHSVLSDLLGANGYVGRSNTANNPVFVAAYFNGSAKPAPIIPGYTTTIDTAATVDEGGNFIDIRFGPLTLWNCLDGSGAVKTPQSAANCPLFGDYHINTGSSAINAGTNSLANFPVNGVSTAAPNVDYDNATRALTAANPADIGADELGNGLPPPPPTSLPALTVLDNFNRGNANTLGGSWSQIVLFGQASIRVNANQASDVLLPGWAIWNGAGNVFGAKQGAAFTFANTTLNNSWLILKASGGSLTTPANYIRVSYASGQVTVSTTNNGNSLAPAYVTRATFPASFASGDTLSATADADGTVSVFRTSGTTTLVGSITIATSGTGAWTQGTGGGRIGMLLPANARVDNFSGGTVP